ncbi:MAG: DMT family transporter [Muribaculum sp.]|nr:DMT family transporter [Muribaculum sp.]
MFLANMGWGIMSPVSKDILLKDALTPLGLSAVRIAGGALLFLLFSFLLPASVAPREKIDRGDWWKILLCSILMVSANQGLFILGIGFTSPVDSSVMSSMTPILTMILSAILLGFPMTAGKVFGVILGFVGVVALVIGSGDSAKASNPLLGNGLCLTAQLCAAIYYVVFRNVIMKYSAFTMMKWMFVIAALTYVPCCIPALLHVDFLSFGSDIWFELLYIIVCGTFLSYLAIPFSQKYLKPTMVSMYNYFQPVFAAIIAVALGVGDFGIIKALATLLIFIGIFFVNRSPAQKS